MVINLVKLVEDIHFIIQIPVLSWKCFVVLDLLKIIGALC